MPHLQRTNLALAQFVGGIAKNMHKDGRLVVIDCGSGSGGTLAPTIKELSETADGRDVSVFSVEPNPDYAQGLKAFAPKFMKSLQKIDPEFELVTSDTDIQAERSSTLSLVETDIVRAIDSLDLSSLGKKDVVAVLNNYVWHRLPSNVKGHILGQMREKVLLAEEAKGEAPAIIVGKADLDENASDPVNRRYFNFGNNGPLNAGNIGIKGLFEFWDFSVMKLGDRDGRVPKSINPALAQAIIKEAANDGHFRIGYYGKEAERLVKAA